MIEWMPSFIDEIKTAASAGRLTISKSRKGRRSMSVETLLRKEKDGTLYKEADVMERSPEAREKVRLAAIAERSGTPVTPMTGCVVKAAEYQEVDPRNPTVRQAVRFSRGDVPAREDIPGRTATEFRPDMAGVKPAGRELASEGFNR